MRRKRYVVFWTVLGITGLLCNDFVFAKNEKAQQEVVSAEELEIQTEEQKDKDAEKYHLAAGVSMIIETDDEKDIDAIIEEASIARIAEQNEEAVIVTKEEMEVVEEETMTAQVQQQDYWGYTNLGIANVDNHLNIRQEPSETGKLIGKLSKNAACEILSTEDGWAHIKSGKVDGYCKEEYLFTGDAAINKAKEVASLIAVVNTETLKVREQPNTNSVVITLIPVEEELEVVEIMDNGWIKFLLDDEEAYVSGDYVDVEERLEKASTLTELMYGQGVSNVRVDLVQYAKQFIGNPYVWGGTSLTNGADCSGFTMSVFKKYGISLPHYSVAQSQMGKQVTLAEVQPGDLVFYAKNGTINHVAIYMGGGQVVHASSPKTGIKISNVNYRTPAVIRSYFD